MRVPHAHLAQTPSPFRLSRRQPSTRRSAGPQFANSPRFLLSQSTSAEKKNDVDIDECDDAPPSIARAAPQSRGAVPPPRRQREVIEDSDDGVPLGGDETREETDEVIDDAIDRTPPGALDTPGVFDDDFDVLFSPGRREGQKRRRLETVGQPSRNPQRNNLPSSSPESQRIPGAFDSPAPHPTPSAAARQTNTQSTPAVRNLMGPGVSTPATTKTPFRSKPRFMLSTKKPPSTQPTFRGNTPLASQAPSPPERRRPAFVLPRSPSPSAVAEDIPAPFSPSSRALRRRGRPRAGVEDYAPGGMAAEVRSWILEMGSRREGVPTVQPNPDDMTRYLRVVRVVQANQAVLSSSGPLAFIRAEIVNASSREEDGLDIMNVMTMGLPRSKPASRQIVSRPGSVRTVAVEEGDLIGIHRGLAWDVELHVFQGLVATEGLQRPLSENNGCINPQERWLVAMEWDIVSR
ncbi:hypothetical protein N7532_001695 [Penicillium argentinense]|uniref:Uncharacterized protein n=1 Tax=Penicillium argentinense TaxID=1131581 RepID=A0A9W9G2Y9_9EURO|nr:uncharacterized protein N7532_001695 [Penicillium argentinense]KAJ5111160.1 hypothetical protein N7532_001695 [Penicillium argentinense]